MEEQKNLYEIKVETQTQGQTTAISRSESFAVEGLLSNIVYYLAIFALVYTIFYALSNFYWFRYYNLTKKAKEYAKEWQGLQHLLSSFRFLVTLLCLQFPLVLYYFASIDKEFVAQIVFFIIFIICFFVKLVFDTIRNPRFAFIAKDYQNLNALDQFKLFFKNQSAKATAAKSAPAPAPAPKPPAPKKEEKPPAK